MIDSAAAVAAAVALDRRTTGRTAYLGVDGWGAAGKSSLAARMAAAIPRAAVVAIDDFASPRLPEWDWHRFSEQVGAPLLNDRPARYQRWVWATDAGGEWCTVEPGSLVIVEGVSATREEVGLPWDLRVWVDAPRAVRLDRVLARDSDALLATWLGTWLPSEDAYVATQRPIERADLVVDGTT